MKGGSPRASLGQVPPFAVFFSPCLLLSGIWVVAVHIPASPFPCHLPDTSSPVMSSSTGESSAPRDIQQTSSAAFASSASSSRKQQQQNQRNEALDNLGASVGSWEGGRTGTTGLSGRGGKIVSTDAAAAAGQQAALAASPKTSNARLPPHQPSAVSSSSGAPASILPSEYVATYTEKPRPQKEGYGFRPSRSGATTPTTATATATTRQEGFQIPSMFAAATTDAAQDAAAAGSSSGQVQDVVVGGAPDWVSSSDGLGWPAKSTHLRLHSTPAESNETLAKLSGAIRTVLECIGEDPDREGLERTPERYAKALMWMTKGYEERLSGEPEPSAQGRAHSCSAICR